MTDTIRQKVQIQNIRGLHARAAAKFSDLADNFDADIQVSKDNTSVNGAALMDLLMLGAGIGSTIEISATGPDAESAVTALVALVNNLFDEKA